MLNIPVVRQNTIAKDAAVLRARKAVGVLGRAKFRLFETDRPAFPNSTSPETDSAVYIINCAIQAVNIERNKAQKY